MDVQTILEELGYKLAFDGEHFRTSALYRSGDNGTALRIHRRTGRFVDFPANESGSLEKLIKLTLNLPGAQEASDWLQKKNFTIEKQFAKPQIEMPHYFDPCILRKLMPAYQFYLDRGISEKTIRKFQGGVAMSGKMNNRFTFPVYEEQGRIIGFAGRDLSGNRDPKWKILGPKRLFAHPYPLIKDEIKDNPIVLVESIGDMLKLYEAGILSFPTFGLKLGQSLLKLLVCINPVKIIVGMNNEPENEARGNSAAALIENQLLQVFDRERIILKLPTKKDFGEMSVKEIKEWKI